MSRTSSVPKPGRTPHAGAGFTLIEVLVAVAILSICLLALMGQRTEAIITAQRTRDLRLARELAERTLSQIESGTMELVESGIERQFEKFPGFSYTILVGEQSIADDDKQILEEQSYAPSGNDPRALDRRRWQLDRDEQRRLQRANSVATPSSTGTSGNAGTLGSTDASEALRKIQSSEAVPSEDEFETVSVTVKFRDNRKESGYRRFTLKKKISTLAISGLTSEQADERAASKGPPAAGSGGAGNTASTGGSK